MRSVITWAFHCLFFDPNVQGFFLSSRLGRLLFCGGGWRGFS